MFGGDRKGAEAERTFAPTGIVLEREEALCSENMLRKSICLIVWVSRVSRLSQDRQGSFGSYPAF